jgi:hypothetical protein
LHLRNGRVGFFREGTHELCDARGTRQLLPDTCEVIDQLARRLRASPAIGGELEESENIAATDRVAHFEPATAVDGRGMLRRPRQGASLVGCDVE